MSPGRGRMAVLALAVAALAVATAVVWSDRGDRRAPAPTQAAAALDGRALFAAKGCAVCHFAPGFPNRTSVGPDLRGIAAVAGSRVPGLDAGGYVRQSIADPGAFVAGPPGSFAMPDLGLTSAEIDALVGFLLSSAPS